MSMLSVLLRSVNSTEIIKHNVRPISKRAWQQRYKYPMHVHTHTFKLQLNCKAVSLVYISVKAAVKHCRDGPGFKPRPRQMCLLFFFSNVKGYF